MITSSSLQPDDAVAYFNRGNVKFNLGQFQGAIADYDQAIALQPDARQAPIVNRGKAKAELGQLRGRRSPTMNQAVRLKWRERAVTATTIAAEIEQARPSGLFEQEVMASGNFDGYG